MFEFLNFVSMSWVKEWLITYFTPSFPLFTLMYENCVNISIGSFSGKLENKNEICEDLKLAKRSLFLIRATGRYSGAFYICVLGKVKWNFSLFCVKGCRLTLYHRSLAAHNAHFSTGTLNLTHRICQTSTNRKETVASSCFFLFLPRSLYGNDISPRARACG